MIKTPNPHDQFFKEIISQPGARRDFLRFYLPEKIVRLIEPDTAERVEDSFVDEELKEHLSDLLFRVKLKNKGEAFIYVLLEHKSSSDKWVALQLFRYLARIWEKAQREGRKKLPLVFPVVFYHGKAKWRVSQKFSGLLDFGAGLNELREYLPEFGYHLCDLSQFVDDELKGEAELQAAMRLLKYIFRAELHEQMEKAFRLLMLESSPEATMSERVIVLINYVLQSGKATYQQVGRVLRRINEEKGAKIMDATLRKSLNKGIKQGLEQGLRQGSQQAALRITLRLIQKRLGGIESRMKTQVSALSVAKLEELGEALFDLETIADLAKWLHQNAAKSEKN